MPVRHTIIKALRATTVWPKGLGLNVYSHLLRAPDAWPSTVGQKPLPGQNPPDGDVLS